AGNLHVSLTPQSGSASPLVGRFPLQAALWDADVQFFPEGGELIAGLTQKIAFKAVGNDGLGLPVKGEVVGPDNRAAASFTDTHLGMGQFTFVPQAGSSYTAKVTFENGQERTYPLPP